MKLEQAARQVVDAWDLGEFSTRMDETITALREALAEPKRYNHETGSVLIPNPLAEQAEQRSDSERMEPVAEVVLRNQTVGFGRTEERKDVMFLADVDVGTKLYAKSQQQAEQEPVCIDWDTKTDEPIIGYAAPVRTKDLTDKQIEKVWNKNGGYMGMPIDFARAVIAADREKNQ